MATSLSGRIHAEITSQGSQRPEPLFNPHPALCIHLTPALPASGRRRRQPPPSPATWLGIVTVLLGQVAGLTLNWRLCRGVLRPRMQRWLEGRRRSRRLRWLLQQPAEIRLLLLLRLAAIPMTLVNGACAIGPTPLRPYLLTSLVLVLPSC